MIDIEKIQKIAKKGTTTLGVICKDGVVLASDMRGTLGTLISSEKTKKIYKIDDTIAMTIAGIAGDAERLVRVLKAESQLYKIRRGPITVSAASTLLANILNSSRYFPFLTHLLVAGYDRTGYKLYAIDPLGSIEGEEDKIFATGSGSPIAYGVLEEGYKEGMTVEEGIALAVRAIKSARKRDIGTGGIMIDVATITSKGFSRVPESKIKKLLAA